MVNIRTTHASVLVDREVARNIRATFAALLADRQVAADLQVSGLYLLVDAGTLLDPWIDTLNQTDGFTYTTESYSLSNARSTLATDLAADALTLTLVDATAFPATGQFDVSIDGELVLATRMSDTMLRLAVRPAGASHSAGVTVAAVVTAEALDKYEYTRPVLALNPKTTLQDPTGWTWKNQSTVTIVGTNVILGGSETGGGFWGLYKALPSYPIQAKLAFRTRLPVTGTPAFRAEALGLLLVDTANNRATAYSIGDARYYKFPSFRVRSLSGATWATTNYALNIGLPITDVFWMRFLITATSMTVDLSADGQTWLQVHQDASTYNSYGALTISQIGIGGNHTDAAALALRQTQLLQLEGF